MGSFKSEIQVSAEVKVNPNAPLAMKGIRLAGQSCAIFRIVWPEGAVQSNDSFLSTGRSLAQRLNATKGKQHVTSCGALYLDQRLGDGLNNAVRSQDEPTIGRLHHRLPMRMAAEVVHEVRHVVQWKL